MMETQVKALTTLLSALGAFFVCGNSAFSQQISTFYGPSVQAMETRLGARQRRRPPTVHRGSTHAPRPQRPVASEDKASACSELRLGCHPETPVIEPCLGRDGLGARREECPVACESDERKPAVMEKRQNEANFALALVYEWFAVRTRNGEIELEKRSQFGRSVGGGSQVDRDRMSQGP